MAKSVAFARIKSNVLELIARVPPGKLTTFAAIAALCDIEPRQVAYLLATCPDANEDGAPIPWHRAVAIDGSLQQGKRRSTHAKRLQDENHRVTAGRVTVPKVWHRLGAPPKTALPHPRRR
jgi:methylated-DNA-protein-cysteine methyltransferase related protein